MNYSFDWLGDFVNLNSTSPKQLAELLGQHSFEVESFQPGTFLRSKDTVFDLASFSNRVDLLVHYGLALELAAQLGKKPKKTLGARFDYGKRIPELSLSVDRKICPKFSLLHFRGVKVAESPDWIKSRLLAVGVKPVNSVVDITNYVMLETGQPLHAFDAQKIQGNKLKIGKLKGRAKFMALNSNSYDLEAGDIVIEDKQGVVSLAGVMGGTESSVGRNTNEIYLEVANWEPVQVRRTSWRLDLRTEAASRFEKNPPLEFVEWGVVRACELLEEICQAELVDSQSVGRTLLKQHSVEMGLDFPSQILGYEISGDKVQSALRRYGFEVKRSGKNLKVNVPFWRSDITGKEDMVEEVGRLLGYKNIPERRPDIPVTITLNFEIRFRQILAGLLQGLGFDEVYNYSFYSRQTALEFGLKEDGHLELANPLSSEQELLRVSLIPRLSATLQENAKHFDSIQLYEFGNIYSAQTGSHFHDSAKLGLAVYERNADAKETFQALKGVVEGLLERLKIEADFSLDKAENSLSPSLKISSKSGKILGVVGLRAEGRDFLALAELDFEILLDLAENETLFQEFSRFPAVTRDFSVLVAKTISWADISKAVAKTNLVQSVELFDVFDGKQVGKDNKDKKSVAFRVTLQSKAKTLTETEVEASSKNILTILKKKFKAQVRN